VISLYSDVGVRRQASVLQCYTALNRGHDGDCNSNEYLEIIELRNGLFVSLRHFVGFNNFYKVRPSISEPAAGKDEKGALRDEQALHCEHG